MQKFRFLFFLVLLVLFIPKETANAWGFFGHQKINNMAVYTLPSDLIGFYKQHLSYISKHAVDADKRRYSDAKEAPRHYIDIDHYGVYGFDSMPHKWKDAVAKYSEDTLIAYGIVPWYIEKMLYQLTAAFKAQNLDLILYYSAFIGHYIADAHVPLHTTENYNGQLTNQKGIHALWESRIPELNAQDYNYWLGAATYIEDPSTAIWQIVASSHKAVDSVLKLEATLSATYPSDKKYSFENRGRKMTKVYSKEYSKAYNELLKGMVERKMREAIFSVGSFWYTAWVNAGKPNLTLLKGKPISDSLKNINKEEPSFDLRKKVRVEDHE
ncbi:MAG: zinc dependent phospholipase C family protein [Bacteroidia bacterium]